MLLSPIFSKHLSKMQLNYFLGAGEDQWLVDAYYSFTPCVYLHGPVQFIQYMCAMHKGLFLVS